MDWVEILADSTVYRLLPHALLPLGGNQTCLVCDYATNNLVLSTRDIPILQNLGKNGSFRELFQRGLSQALGSPRRVMRLLKLLIASNVLIPERDHIHSKTPADDGSLQTPLTAIVNTADRVDFCCRCLASLRDSGDIAAMLGSLLIIDGSRDPANSIELQKKLPQVCRTLAAPVIYFGPQERAKVLHCLAAEGFNKEVLSFIIGESQDVFSAGAARNLALLLTAGRDAVTIDDDAVWKFYILSGAEISSALSLSNETRSWSIHFYTTREAALQAHSPAPIDAAGAAKRLLGKSLAQVAASWPGAIDDRYACGHMDEDILNRTGCVAAVQVGIVGDSGWHSADLLSAYDEQLAQRFHNFPSTLRTSLLSREVSAYSRTCSIGHDSKCMAIGLFLHNKLPLPPFMPQHRNEDGVFGGMVQACLPHAYSAHLPFAMLHDAAQRSGYQRVERVRACDLALRLIADGTAGGPLGLGGVGLYFAERAALCDRGWARFMKTVTARIRGGRIEEITAPLQRFRNSSPVRQQLQRCRDRLIQDLVDNPTAIAEFGSDIARSRQFVSLFGQMCSTWPALRDCALRNADRLLQIGRNVAKAS